MSVRLGGTCLLLLLAALASGAESGKDSATSEAVLSALRAADEARSTEAAEAAAWHRERARLRLLIDHLESAIAAEEQQAEDLAARVTTLQDQLGELRDAEEDARALENRLAGAARVLRAGLQRARDQLPPGVVSTPAGSEDGDAESSFTAALADLRRSEEAAAETAVHIVSVQHGDGQQAVKLLRIGAAGLWWQALDGSDAGPARLIDGELVALPAADERAAEAVRAAIAMREGRRPVALVSLPIPPAAVAEAE